MKIKDLIKILAEDDKLIDIDIEDYEGNTIAKLSDLEWADTECEGEKTILRLQLWKKYTTISLYN